jgi:hypothetical protein
MINIQSSASIKPLATLIPQYEHGSVVVMLRVHKAANSILDNHQFAYLSQVAAGGRRCA